MNLVMDRLTPLLLQLRSRLLFYSIVGGVVLTGLLLFLLVNESPLFPRQIAGEKTKGEVAQPTIVNGELVLPKEVSLGQSGGLGQLAQNNRLVVNSAILSPVYDQQQKLTGIRILGEVTNIGTKVIDGVSPVVRFFSDQGVSVGQKVGVLSSGYRFFSLEPGARSVYDVTVDNPPTSDRLEIVMNATSATSSALFEPMKIASRSVEVKTAKRQIDASASAELPSSVEYFTVSGSVVNIASDPFSEITVYAWAKGTDGKILSFATQEFRNDLLNPSDKLDFRITLLPFREGISYDTTEIAAWGKRYKLNL